MGFEHKQCNSTYGCTSLVNLSVDSSIGSSSFKNCTSLEKVQLGDNVRIIGEQSFSDCSAVQETVFPEGLETIERQAFNNCTSLNKVTLPKTLKTVGAEIFSGCHSLKSLWYRGSSSNWANVDKDKKWNAEAGATYITSYNAE